MGNKLKTVDAETLLSTSMSKTMFIVDGLISQGVNVISGASKIGKSWLMLWLGRSGSPKSFPASSSQAAYRSFHRKRQNSLAPLLLLSPQSHAALRGPRQ